jgi:hypothetical protein
MVVPCFLKNPKFRCNSVQATLNSQFLIQLISIEWFEYVLVSQDGMTRKVEKRLVHDVLFLESGPTKDELFEKVYRLAFDLVDFVKLDLSSRLDEDDLNWDVDDDMLETLSGDRFQLKFENAQTEIIITFGQMEKTLLTSKIGRA